MQLHGHLRTTHLGVPSSSRYVIATLEMNSHHIPTACGAQAGALEPVLQGIHKVSSGAPSLSQTTSEGRVDCLLESGVRLTAYVFVNPAAAHSKGSACIPPRNALGTPCTAEARAWKLPIVHAMSDAPIARLVTSDKLEPAPLQFTGAEYLLADKPL